MAPFLRTSVSSCTLIPIPAWEGTTIFKPKTPHLEETNHPNASSLSKALLKPARGRGERLRTAGPTCLRTQGLGPRVTELGNIIPLSSGNILPSLSNPAGANNPALPQSPRCSHLRGTAQRPAAAPPTTAQVERRGEVRHAHPTSGPDLTGPPPPPIHCACAPKARGRLGGVCGLLYGA